MVWYQINQATSQCQECKLWLNSLRTSGSIALIPEIADYELRRELLRAGKTRGIKQLDQLKTVILYLPITTEVMLKAAELWATARQGDTQRHHQMHSMVM